MLKLYLFFLTVLLFTSGFFCSSRNDNTTYVSSSQTDSTTSATADIPDELKAFVGSMGGFYSVHLEGETVVYESHRRSEATHTTTFTPTQKDWEKFNSLLNEADVWNWKTVYNDIPDLQDGTQWRFYIKQGGREKKTEGSNTYPPLDKFKKYLEAIRAIINNNLFP